MKTKGLVSTLAGDGRTQAFIARPVRERGPPSPLGFPQVFILKGVKIVFSDTILQVFILKEIEESGERLVTGE